MSSAVIQRILGCAPADRGRTAAASAGRRKRRIVSCSREGSLGGVAGRADGELGDGLEGAGLLFGRHREKTVAAALLPFASLRGEEGEAVVADGDASRRGESEVATVGEDGVEHAALVPAG